MIANQTQFKQIWPISSLPAETAHEHRHTSRHSPQEQLPYPCILHECVPVCSQPPMISRSIRHPNASAIRQSADIAVWSHLPLSPPGNFYRCCLHPLHKVPSDVHRFRQIFSPPHRICPRTCSSSFVTDPANTNHSLSFVSVCLIYRDGYTVCRLHESSSFSSSSKSLTIFYRHTVIHLSVPQLHI